MIACYQDYRCREKTPMQQVKNRILSKMRIDRGSRIDLGSRSRDKDPLGRPFTFLYVFTPFVCSRTYFTKSEKNKLRVTYVCLKLPRHVHIKCWKQENSTVNIHL